MTRNVYTHLQIIRNAPTLQSSRRPLADDSFDFEDLAGLSGPAERDRERSRSHSLYRDAVDSGANSHLGSQRISLTPLVEEPELTEEEKDAKFGPWVKISVEMVVDPRTPITAQNRQSAIQYCAPMELKMRAVRYSPYTGCLHALISFSIYRGKISMVSLRE